MRPLSLTQILLILLCSIIFGFAIGKYYSLFYSIGYGIGFFTCLIFIVGVTRWFLELSSRRKINFLRRLTILLTLFSIIIYFAFRYIFLFFAVLIFPFVAAYFFFVVGIGLFVYEIYLLWLNGYWEPKTVLDFILEMNRSLNPQTVSEYLLDYNFGINRLLILLNLSEFWQRVVSLYLFVPLIIISIPFFFLYKLLSRIYDKVIEPILAVYWRKLLDYLFCD